MDKTDNMKFNKFFGLERSELGEVLIISPFFNARLVGGELKDEKFFKGIFFHGVNGVFENQRITFINTGMGQTFVTDCVLAQDSARIKTIIFLGAVGAIQSLDIADNVVIEEACFDTQYYKKFDIEFKQDNLKQFHADGDLVKHSMFLAQKENMILKKINVISLHTFWEQDAQKVEQMYKENRQSVDLECALFYAASAYKGIKGIAFCFVSDNLATRPFWGDFSAQERFLMKKRSSELIRLSLLLAQKQ